MSCISINWGRFPMVRWCFLRCRFGNEMDLLCWNLGINEEPTCTYIRNRTTIRKQIVPCFNLQARAHISQCRKESMAKARLNFKPNMLAYSRNIFLQPLKIHLFSWPHASLHTCAYFDSPISCEFFPVFFFHRPVGGWMGGISSATTRGRDGKRLHTRKMADWNFSCVCCRWNSF